MSTYDQARLAGWHQGLRDGQAIALAKVEAALVEMGVADMGSDHERGSGWLQAARVLGLALGDDGLKDRVYRAVLEGTPIPS